MRKLTFYSVAVATVLSRTKIGTYTHLSLGLWNVFEKTKKISYADTYSDSGSLDTETETTIKLCLQADSSRCEKARQWMFHEQNS